MRAGAIRRQLNSFVLAVIPDCTCPVALIIVRTYDDWMTVTRRIHPADRSRSRFLQVLCKEFVCHFGHLVEPDLLTQKRMWRVFDDSEIGLQAQVIHARSKCIRMRAGIVDFARHEPAGRVVLIQVMQGRREAIRCWLVLLCTTKKLSPDPATFRDCGNVTCAFRKKIRLCAHGHGRLNRAAEAGIPAVAFKFLHSGRCCQ